MVSSIFFSAMTATFHGTRVQRSSGGAVATRVWARGTASVATAGASSSAECSRHGSGSLPLTCHSYDRDEERSLLVPLSKHRRLPAHNFHHDVIGLQIHARPEHVRADSRFWSREAFDRAHEFIRLDDLLRECFASQAQPEPFGDLATSREAAAVNNSWHAV
jgi:hypothetical protein